VQAVLFDAVGTLFRSSGSIGEIYSEVAAAHGVEIRPELLDERFEALVGRGMPLSRNEWHRLVQAAAGDSFGPDGFEAFFDDVYRVFQSGAAWRLFAETPTVLERLRDAGFELGVVTNFDNRVMAVLEELGIRSLFHTIQTPEGSGYRKPQAGIFQAAVASLGATARTTLFIGDDPLEDFQGARSAGLEALLLDRRLAAPDSPLVIPDLTRVLSYLGLS